MANDFLNQAIGDGYDPNDALAQATVGGRSAGYESFFGPPKTPLPTSSPDYHRLTAIHQNLVQTEAAYHRRLREFDQSEGAALRRTHDPVTGKVVNNWITPEDRERVEKNLGNITNPGGAALDVDAALARVQQHRMDPLLQKRKWLADEAMTVSKARQDFETNVYLPARSRIADAMTTNQFPGQAPTQAPREPTDYLAPEGLDWQSQRIRDIQQRRRLNNEAPIPAGSMGDPGAKWSPVGPIETTDLNARVRPTDNEQGDVSPTVPDDRPAEDWDHAPGAAAPAEEKPVAAPFKGASSAAGSGIADMFKGLGTLGEYFRGGAVPGAIGVTAALRAIEPASKQVADIQASPENKLGDYIQQAVNETYPLSDAERKSLFTKVGEGVGGFIPMLATGPGAPVAMGVQAIGGTLDREYNESLKNGADPDSAAKTAIEKSLADGAVQAAVFRFLPEPLKKMGDKFVDQFGRSLLAKFLAGRVAQGAEGAVLGGVSKGGENLVTGRPATEGLGEATAGMAITQALLPRGARANDEPPGQPRLINGDQPPFPALPAGEQPLPLKGGDAGRLPAADDVKALPMGEETRWEFGTPEGIANAKRQFQALQQAHAEAQQRVEDFHKARAEELQQTMREGQAGQPEQNELPMGPDPLKNRLAMLDARVGPAGAEGERTRIQNAMAARTSLIQELRRQNVPDQQISQMTGLHPEVVSAAANPTAAEQAPGQARVTPGPEATPGEPPLHEQAGFDSAEHLANEHRDNGLHEHGETLEEFAQRTYCAGLGGRNTFSIR